MKKTHISDLVIPILLLIDGMICALTAIFAHDIGLDPNIVWGRTRYSLLFLGILLISVSLLSNYFKRKNKFFESTIKSESVKFLFLFGYLFHLWFFIFFVYAWFITFGNFTTWNRSTRCYTQLADAFGKGQLYIDIDPGEALLEVKNPYSTIVRPSFNDDIWDMSLYKGKLYLYWGPVPALLITPIQMLINKKITDIFLVYFFSAGLLIFNSLIILKLWQNFFSNISVWNMLICIPLIGLILPILWLINEPTVYQAAIGAGQFNLMGGIYFVILAFEDRTVINKGDLFLAGFFWTCSVGSRAMNVLSILFLMPLIIFLVFKSMPKPTDWAAYVKTLSALFFPLIAGAMTIGWYNWARFDSPFEFGMRYQITIHDLNQLMRLTFQADYFLPNLYVYVLQPFEFISKFPFIQPISIAGLFEKLNIIAPKIYFSGRMTGFLLYAPFLVFAFLPLFSKTKNNGKSDRAIADLRYKFVVSLLAISFAINFLSLLFFFFGQLRYFVDIISQITLLAIIGYWELISRSQSLKTLPSKYFVGLANLLIAITICVSFLLSFSSESNRMEKFNPQLIEKINSFLTISKYYFR